MTKTKNPLGTGGESDPRHCIVVVAGEHRTGKSSLILTVHGRDLPENGKVVPSVLPPTDTTVYGVPITILDTRGLSCTATKRSLKKAHVIVLTYACDRRDTFDKLIQCWLPYLVNKKLNKVPVVVVGCKQDLPRDMDRDWKDFDLHCKWLTDEFPNVDIYFECSAKTSNQVWNVFPSALRAIFYPIPPLLDLKRELLSDRLEKALRLIFLMLDLDDDEALSETEFNLLALPQSFDDVKCSIGNFLPGRGITPSGDITLAGFLTLHKIYIEYSQHETTWATVKAFGFDDELKYVDLETIQRSFPRQPHLRPELTFEAKDFLTRFFVKLNLDKDDVLPAAGVDRLFATELDSQACCKDEVALTASGGLSFNVFLSMWDLMAIRDPVRTFANLINLGFVGHPNLAMKPKLDGEVCQCFVFGRKKAGKSAFLGYFLGRKLSESYTSTTTERFAVNDVPLKDGSNRTLIMREIPEDESLKVLSSEESLASCDIAVFVYHSSDEKSWERAKELCAKIVDYGVPCLFIAAKRGCPKILEDSILLSQSMGLGAPLSINMKSRRRNDVFVKIVEGAAGRKRNLTLPSDPLETEMIEKSTEVGVENMEVDDDIESMDEERGSSSSSSSCSRRTSGSPKMRLLSEILENCSLSAPLESEMGKKSGENEVEYMDPNGGSRSTNHGFGKRSRNCMPWDGLSRDYAQGGIHHVVSPDVVGF